jgi:hypothetical protein
MCNQQQQEHGKTNGRRNVQKSNRQVPRLRVLEHPSYGSELHEPCFSKVYSVPENPPQGKALDILDEQGRFFMTIEMRWILVRSDTLVVV